MRITRHLTVDDLPVSEKFIQSPGPGGQNVNKVATAVELRLHLTNADKLSDDTKERIRRLAGNRLTESDDVIIVASNHRSQNRNRTEARKRLVALIQKALETPRKRKSSRRPSWANKKRLSNKKKRGEKKELRKKPDID